MAVGTLLVLDAGLPGGFIDGSGTMRRAQTMAFTTLVLFQLFNVFNARSDEASAFHQLFHNKWLWSAVTVSVSLQIAVIYVPVLQVAFSTQALTFGEWMQCTVVASCVLWFRDASKYVGRLFTSD